MGSGPRILGLPVQFAVVALVSLALTIYMAGWAASANIESRNIRVEGAYSLYENQANAGAQTWERAAILVCPLH